VLRRFFGSALLVIAGTAFAQAQAPLRAIPPLDTELRADQTALVVVDFQNAFAAKEGGNNKAMQPRLDNSGMIPTSIALVKKARELGVQVIHVTEGYYPDYRELDHGNGGLFHRGQIIRQTLKMGDWSIDLFEGMRPGPDDKDIILPNRTAMSGFGGNNLDYILKARGIRNVAVIGFTTEVCVYATLLNGYDLGYRMFAVSDGTIGFDEATAREMLRWSYPLVSRVMKADDVVKMITIRK